MRNACLACTLIAVTTAPLPALAAGDGDGAYGRLDGDVSLVMGVGAAVAPSTGRLASLVDVRARYLEVAGLFGHYEESGVFGGSSDGAWIRSFGAGVELRPLFPIRFLKNAESGHAFGDLLLDSLGFDLGVTWTALEASGPRPGFRCGIALELPLFSAAQGLYIRTEGSLRWREQALLGQGEGPYGVLGLSLAWHQTIDTHLVDLRDRAAQ